MEKIFKICLRPILRVWIAREKIKKFLKGSYESNSENLFDVFEYLLQNNTGKDHDAKYVASFLNNQPEEDRDFYLKAITKKLRMGIDSTVNKIYGKGFLNEFKLMLAKDFYKESHKVEGKEFALTEKLDGQRAAIVKNDEDIKIFSRSGQPISDLIEIIKEIELLPDGVYDGELLIKGEDMYKNREVLQETLKITRKDGAKTGINFWIFDFLSNEEFENGCSKQNYLERRKEIENILVSHSLTSVRLLPILYVGNDTSVIPNFLKDIESQNKEGLMLNILNALYECKRTDSLLKIKSMLSFDEYCVDVFEGEGKYKNMLGGVIVNYKNFSLRVGSGFTDEERKYLWNNKDLIVGEIVEVQYFRESKNADGGISVSFPVFKGIRKDKKEVSYH